MVGMVYTGIVAGIVLSHNSVQRITDMLYTIETIEDFAYAMALDCSEPISLEKTRDRFKRGGAYLSFTFYDYDRHTVSITFYVSTGIAKKRLSDIVICYGFDCVPYRQLAL